MVIDYIGFERIFVHFVDESISPRPAYQYIPQKHFSKMKIVENVSNLF
jgi:hypothetical protein